MLSNILRLLFIFVMRLTLRYRLTTNKHHYWDSTVCCCSFIIINTYTIQNGLDAYTYFTHCALLSRIRWWQGTRGQTTYMILLACYTARNMIHAYIYCLHATREYLANFSSDSYVSVKF